MRSCFKMDVIIIDRVPLPLQVRRLPKATWVEQDGVQVNGPGIAIQDEDKGYRICLFV